MRNFRELNIWKRSFALVTQVYQLSETFPSTEKFGLMLQIRRCAVSIPSNIAEGCGRNTDKDLLRFLDISMGSAFELETQLLLAEQLEFIKNQNIAEVINELHEIQKMITGFKKSLTANS